MSTEAEDLKAQQEQEQVRALKGDYKYGWHDKTNYTEKPEKGLSHSVIDMMSDRKGEPDWMRKFRHKSLDVFYRKPMPQWGADLSSIDFDDIYYYIKPTGQVKDWDEMPEDIKATWDKLGIPEAEKNYLGGVSAQYECLRGDTSVWTTKGYRLIKEIGPGDRVFALNEETKQLEIAEVVGAAQSGEKAIFEIHARGRKIGASSNHPFLVLRDERKPGRERARWAARWIPAEELVVGDMVAVASDLPNFGEPYALIALDEGGQFPRETSDDLMWWIGMFIGDGYITGGGSKLELAVDKDDETLIEEFIRVSGELFGLDFSLASDGLRLRARGTRPLVDFLALNGIGGSALTKSIPGWVYGLPRSQRLAFLAGYCDSDGYVRDHPLNKDLTLTSANSDLLFGVQELAALCGITTSGPFTFTNKAEDLKELRVGYRLLFSGNFDQIHCRSPRRADRLGKRRFYHRQNSAGRTTIRTHTSDTLGFVRIDGIDRKASELTYDIEVAGHHNFVAEGFVVHNSESVYHKTKVELENRGVIFLDMDTALREHPDVVKQYFGTIIPPADNKFSALNSAVWSGGSFIYVPPGVEVEIPLQAYFRINQENMGQFERTLIIVDEGAYVHYVEGCSAPVYSGDSLHSAVVEIIVKKDGRARYTTIQNWSNNVYNLVTKRAVAHQGAIMEWVDGNLGCIAEGERVATRNGLKPIENIEAGDEVLSYEETTGHLVYKAVVAKKFSGHQPVRSVVNGDRRIRVTDNHPFLSLAGHSSDERLAWVRADHLTRAFILTNDRPTVHEGRGVAVLERAATETRLVPVAVGPADAVVPTWDIQVEGTANFVCQGFIVHNSKITMKYPAVYLLGEHARGEVLSIAYAGKGQHQDAGGKMVHAAPNTSSSITSKSISKDGGRAGYRGLVRIEENAKHAKSHVVCDALILDDISRSDTYPYIEIDEESAAVSHEATVSKVSDEQLFYLMSRGLDETQAMQMIVRGFIEPITKELPMEYAVELQRLVELQMEGSVG